jgi:hypothetical protein
MRRLLWIAAVAGGDAFMWWIVRGGPDALGHGSVLGAVKFIGVLSFVVSPIGSIWMVCHAFRQEKNPWWFVFAAGVPWVFTWYYFQRAKPLTARFRELHATNDRSVVKGGNVVTRTTSIQTARRPAGPGFPDVSKGEQDYEDKLRQPRKLAFNVAWVLFFSMTTSFAAWIALGNWTPSTRLELVLVALFFTAHPIGAVWMLADSMIRKRVSLSLFFFAAVPYSFIWYYFKRVSASSE